MSVLIKGMKMPTRCEDCFCYRHNAEYDYAYCNISSVNVLGHGNARPVNCPMVELPAEHGRLIDADALRAKMYHEAFETDTPMQKWDSGCWIRYKMFERMEEAAPTIIPAEEGDG